MFVVRSVDIYLCGECWCIPERVARFRDGSLPEFSQQGTRPLRRDEVSLLLVKV